MKNIYLSLFFVFFIQISNAQKKKSCTVLFCKAYATTIFPGTVMVDNNGNEIPQKNTYSRKIYIATSCNIAPKITSVLYNKLKATIIVKAIKEKKLELGNDGTANKEIIVDVTNANYLWEIDINLQENNLPTSEIKSIMIEGFIGSKKYFILKAKEVNIIPLIMPV